MGTSGAPSARRISYSQARAILVAAGLGVLGLVAAFTYIRRVETAEVVATLLFIPIFLAFVFADVPGGVVAGVLAALAYGAVRYPAVQAIGAGRFTTLLISRAAAFVAFGLLGGWANRQLEASLAKLELYDQIDDETGLHNARFFLQDTDLEMSRSKRYQTLFSLAVVDIPAPALDSLSRRQRAGALREIGRMLHESMRTVDRASHAKDGRRHRVAVILPETAAEGANIFASRLAKGLSDYLVGRGAPLDPKNVVTTVAVFPGDEQVITEVRSEFAEIERSEHPEENKVGT
jgi:GGDEF domain-containing protein